MVLSNSITISNSTIYVSVLSSFNLFSNSNGSYSYALLQPVKTSYSHLWLEGTLWVLLSGTMIPTSSGECYSSSNIRV